MKRIVAATISLLSICADASDGTSWIRRAPAEFRPPDEVLARAEFQEVLASTVETAEAALSDREFVLLSEDDVASYVGQSFRCAKPARPFLVRAVYGHKGTGGYQVERHNSTIFVIHGSLGHSTPVPTKSALVVCAKEVQEVFTAFSVAE